MADPKYDNMPEKAWGVRRKKLRERKRAEKRNFVREGESSMSSDRNKPIRTDRVIREGASSNTHRKLPDTALPKAKKALAKSKAGKVKAMAVKRKPSRSGAKVS